MIVNASKFDGLCWLLIGLTGCSPAEGEPGDPVASMNRGVGLLEEYNYGDAYRVFDRLVRAHPGWEAAHVNRGIAALNLQKDDEKKIDYLPIAEQAFVRALEINPKCIHALLSRGMLYQHTNRVDEMLRDFDAAARLDPRDPQVLFQRAVALMEKGRGDEARADLEKVVQLQPSFASAYWRLRESYVKSGEPQTMSAAIKEFQRLESAEMGIKAGIKYGEGGKYNLAIRNSVPPGWKGPVPAWKAQEAPMFAPRDVISAGPIALKKRPDDKHAAPAFGLCDLTGDGVLELVTCGEKGEGGALAVAVHSLHASGAWELRRMLPFEAALCATVCASGDLDGDFDTDLVLAGEGWLRIYLNDGTGELNEQSLKAEGASHAGFPVRLYVLDADSDWDLDIVCLRQQKEPDGKVRSRLEVLNNNRDGTFKEIAQASGIPVLDFPAVELVAADLDGDVDLDFLVFDGATGAAHAFANDRVWKYHRVDAGDAGEDAAPKATGLVSTAGGDFDGDGDEDLVLFCGESLRFWRNAGGLVFEEDAAFTKRFGAFGGAAGVLADFQGALSVSLIVFGAEDPAAGSASPRGAVFIASPDAEKAVPLLLGGVGADAERSATAAVLGPDRPPAVIVYDSAAGAVSFPLATRSGWLVLDLEGPKKPVSKLERANAAGVGASVEVRAGPRSARFLVHTGAGGAARAPARVFCGLAGAPGADYVRILWPDSVLQSELGLAGGRVRKIKEIERKPSSCPILFTWTGKGWELVADFLGVGGLGYLELPGVYSKPDPSEYVLLPALEPAGGRYLLDILEPLEECTYLDELKLTVVDHPAQLTVIPEEMFAVKGPAPEFRLLAFRERLFPVSARNDGGADVTREVRDVDRRYANEVRRDARFPGLAVGDHAIELDFGGGIRTFFAGPRQPRMYLFLHGYVEYGYSTSNFAAWQAKAVFHAPSVRAERGGKWVTLREEWGFPAGYPRYMTVDLTGLLEPWDHRLRVDTNMDIHWDQAFLADASAGDSLSVTELAADAAELGFRGFPPEEAPDGESPPVYAHRDFDPETSFKTLPGNYTRYGDVRDLLSSVDDRFAILGPGDGLAFEVSVDRLPPLPPGYQRTFLARAFGYCKDMDLYTAHPDRVEPLPFRGMSGYPYRPEEARASPAAQGAYAGEWNTRVVK